MNWYHIGSYIWTSCSAGWLVLFALTDIPACFVVSALCAGMSLFWNLALHDWGTLKQNQNANKEET